MAEYIILLNLYFLKSLKNKKEFIFCFVTFFLFVGFRLETGYDWPVYNTFFLSDKQVNVYNFEIGYFYWNHFLSIFGKKEIILNSGNAILFLILLYFILKKNVENIGLFFYLYFYMNIFILNMAIIRQGISILLFYLMVNNFTKNKKYLYYFLSILFHVSSLIYLPLLYLSKKTYSKKKVIIITVLGIAIFFIRIPYISNFLQILSNNNFFNKLNYYLLIDKPILSLYQIFYAIKNILLLIIFINIEKLDIKKYSSKLQEIFYNLSLLNFLCFFYFYEVPTIFQRIENMTSIGLILYICYLMSEVSKNKKILFYLITIVYFNLMFVYFLTRPLSIVFVPYQNYIYTEKSTGWERTKKLYSDLNVLFKEEVFKEE